MLSLNSIFSSTEYLDEGFDRPRWCVDNGSHYTTLRRTTDERNKDIREILLHHPLKNDPSSIQILVSVTQLYPTGSTTPLLIDDYILSNDQKKVLLFTNSQKVWRLNTRGCYWIVSLQDSSPPYQLGATLPNPKNLMFATFSPCNSRVAYVYENNIFCEDLSSHQVTQLTFDGNENIINGTFDWVYEEEFHLRNGYRWSPDGQQIAYWQLDQTHVPIVHLVNNTDTKYPALIPIHYPKTGDQNSTVRIGVISVDGRTSPTWVSIPCDGEGYHSNSNSYLADMSYHQSSGRILIQQINRLQNHVTIWCVDPQTPAAPRVIFEDRDDAWIDILHEMHWINNGNTFLYISDRNGWKQIFAVNLDDPNQNQNPLALTPVGLDVESIQGVCQSSGYVYYIASPHDPLRRYLFRANFDGTEIFRVTPESAEYRGTNAYTLSKDGNFAIHTFSTAHSPSSFCIVSLPDHQVHTVLASNSRLLQKFQEIKIPPAEFFQVDVGVDPQSGASGLLDAYCLYPPDLYLALQADEPVSPRSYPVIFYVYGEPAAQVARDHWMGKMGLWHRLLAQRGAVVICIDNRGVPALRGRAFRKSIYRRIGILASSDQAKAVEQILESRSYLDPHRVAVWGWSGGGSMSLNLLFRSPELYSTAISVAPVPDMHYYDTIYQERYMGLPSENKEGYEQGSPITFAHQMKSHQNLLLIHGTGDDNCHYATTEKLINELIRLNKPFQMLGYPNRSHSISEGENTTRHLFEQMTRFFARAGLIDSAALGE